MAFQIANNNGSVSISVANSNLNGSGSITSLFTANGAYGSVLNSIRIDSHTATPVGMIRIFIKKPGTLQPYCLLKEIMIPGTTLNDPPFPVFSKLLQVNIPLENGFIIGVSTETATNYVITAFGYDINGFI